MSRYSNLTSGTTKFADMMKRFGVVTVMNAEVYDTSKLAGSSIKAYFESMTADEIYNSIIGNPSAKLCTLDTLKIANITQEGPTKTVNGGQYSNPLIKFGKSARLEMQDALGNYEALDALCGTVSEYDKKGADGKLSDIIALHITEDFAGPRTIVGDSFFIEQKTGRQVPVKILFYQFLPDSIFNLTQDAEGDATVFDMNGDLMTTNIKIGTDDPNTVSHGVFYSIISGSSSTSTSIPTEEVTVESSSSVNKTVEAGLTVDNENDNIAEGSISGTALTISGVSAGSTTISLKKGSNVVKIYKVTVTAAVED